MSPWQHVDFSVLSVFLIWVGMLCVNTNYFDMKLGIGHAGSCCDFCPISKILSLFSWAVPMNYALWARCTEFYNGLTWLATSQGYIDCILLLGQLSYQDPKLPGVLVVFDLNTQNMARRAALYILGKWGCSVCQEHNVYVVLILVLY